MSNRIERIGAAVLYCGDCHEIVAEIVAEIAADAVISDPPYGIGYVPHGQKKRMGS